MTTEYADSNGVRIAWEAGGSGPPLLLIHGLGYARWGWEPLVPILTERFRVVTFDNRGIGASDVPPGPYDAAGMAADAVAVLDAAGIGRSHVMGTSLGGMIAQELVARHPGRVDRLVLLSTTPGGSAAYPIPAHTLDLIARASTLPPEEALRTFVENALGEDPDPPLVARILAHRLASSQDPAGWAAQAAAGTGYGGSGAASAIVAPTLVLHGSEDRVIDHRNVDLLIESIPGAVGGVRPGGHLFFWEHPEELGGEIVSFLEGGDGER
jgi:pimeloyl-ACP methyl ester carboxylesterase